MELGHGLRDSDDGQKGSWSDVGVAQVFIAVSLELSLLNVSGNDVVVEISWDSWIEGLGVSDEGSHSLSVNFGGPFLSIAKLLMDLSNMLGQSQIFF